MVNHREEQVNLLNQDLMGEHQAIVHYLTHAWTVVRPFAGPVEAIARDEMRHFKWLAETIVALGGIPDLTPPDLLPAVSGLEALDYDIDAEEEAISQYLAHQRVIAVVSVQQLLGRILVDERDHRRQFLDLRRQWLDADLPSASTADSSAGERFQWIVSHEYREILRRLMQSFLSRHLPEVGLTAEDRAIESMQHMSWMAEAMADQGGMPRLARTPDTADQNPMAAYQSLRRWAQANMTPLVPLIDRMINHEEYQNRLYSETTWTVGSREQGGWDEHGHLEPRWGTP